MPRARCSKSVEAEKLYHSGKKLVDIARQLGVPDSTVRRWKSCQNWDTDTHKNQTERSEIKPNVRKRGAQPGHAPQGGGIVGNVNAATHGAYMSIYAALLTEEEKELLPAMAEMSERERLMSLYAQHQITERRLMTHINDIADGAEMIIHRMVSQIEPTGQKSANGREITKVVKISQEQETRKEQLRNFTDALTRIRAEMRRVADSLRQLDDAAVKSVVIENAEDALLCAIGERAARIFETRNDCVDETDDVEAVTEENDT
jgi:uncharacterized protein YjcR